MSHTSKKVAILTGATGDLGTDIAKRLADAGHVLCLIGRNQEKLVKALQELNEAYPNHHTIHQCDITKKDHRDLTIDNIIHTHGAPDLVINNAAILGDPKSLHEYTEEEIETTLATNLTGTILFTRKVVAELLKSGSRCKIITLGSTAGLYPYPHRSSYATSKSGLKNFTESVGPEYKKHGIEFTYLCPGPTAGPSVDKIIRDRANLLDISFEQMKKKFSSIVSDEGELLSKEDLLGVIDRIINGDLERLAGQAFTGHTIGFDKHGIYDKSNTKVIEKNEVIKNIPEEQGIKYDKRKYLIKFSGEKTDKKESSILNMNTVRNALSKTYKYAAILLFFFLAGKVSKVDQKIEGGIASFQNFVNNIKDYDYEMKKIAREEYGIDNPEELIVRANEIQDNAILNLYVEIGQKALQNMKKYRKEGTTITGIDLDKPLDI